MGVVKGQKEYEKWEAGTRLTYRQAVLAHCYECNGLEEGRVDCQGRRCVLYAFMPYRSKLRVQRGKKGGLHDKGM